MQKSEKVLIVEDDKQSLQHLSVLLSENGYLPFVARNGEQALYMASTHQPDMILLNLGLPVLDGIEVLKRLRQWYQNPILIVSARQKEVQKVEALNAGADDYITKPYGSAELLARIRVALRNNAKRTLQPQTSVSSYKVGELEIDFEKYLVKVNGRYVHLTQIEFKIIEMLARQSGRVLTYEFLMEHIWGPYLPAGNKILRVNMTNIRKKIEQDHANPRYIMTEAGIGYRMAED